MVKKVTPIINDFRSGELTPGLDARSDIKEYYRGCRILMNAMPIMEGGAERVPGTRYVRPVKLTEEGWCLRVTKSGGGTGTVASDVSPGIDCGASCYYFFPSGTIVVLTATPDVGSYFAEWSGDGTGSTTRTIVMDGDKVVNAEFGFGYAYNHLYFGTSGNEIVKIDLATFTVESLLTISYNDTRSIYCDPVSQRLFAGVNTSGSPYICVVNLSTFTVNSYIDMSPYLASAPTFVMGDYENRILYVIGSMSGGITGFTIVRINMDTLAIIGIGSNNYRNSLYDTNNPVGGRCYDSSFLYIATNGWGTHKIDRNTMAWVSRVTWGSPGYGYGYQAIEPTNNLFYLVNDVTIRKFNTSPFSYSAALTITASTMSGGELVSIDIVNRKIYAGNNNASEAYKIDLATFTLSSTVVLAGASSAVYYTPNTSRIYYGEQNRVQKLTITPHAVEATIANVGVGGDILRCVTSD